MPPHEAPCYLCARNRVPVRQDRTPVCETCEERHLQPAAPDREIKDDRTPPMGTRRYGT